MNTQLFDVLIIGSGPSGLTAGIYTSRANLKTAIIAGDNWGGQLMLTTEVENFPGFPEGIQGPDLMEEIRKQAVRFGAEWVSKTVTQVSFGSRPFKVMCGENSYEAKSIIVATGAEAVWLGVPGEEKLIGRGISSCAPCDAAFFRDKRVFVVGGGDAAMEEALVLTKFAREVTVIHRRDMFRASKIMSDRVMGHPKIKVFWDSEIIEVKGQQKVEGVVIRTHAKRFEQDQSMFLERGQGTVQSQEQDYVLWEANVDGIFVAIGHKPVTEVFKDALALDHKGYIQRKVDDSLFPMMTSKEGIFVAGDVHDHHYRQAVTAAAFGCMAALDVERWLQDLD